MNIKGVDVSEHNGIVDYDYLIKQGVKFSIVRFGIGSKRADYYYKQNVENALSKGLDVGAYWFIYALNEDAARRNAKMFCDLLEPYKGKFTYPVFADFEYDSENYMNQNGVTPTKKLNTAIVKAFCEEVEKYGWYVGNYANPDFINNHFNNSELKKWDLWLAHYDVSKPSFSCSMWQYGEKWNLDADICYVDYPSIIRKAGKNGLAQTTTTKTTTPIEKKEVSQKELFAQIFEHMCQHDGDGGHGYSQVARWGDGTTESVTLPCGVIVEIPNGDFDCSSGIITALKIAGVNTGEASYTGNMRAELMKTGLFEWWPVGVAGKEATRGDIYLNEVHHTAMCTNDNPDMLCQFSISENGTIRGKQGDQTGQESNTRAYYNYPWDGKLHWKTEGKTTPIEEKKVSKLDNKTDEELAQEVLKGTYGVGDERKKALGSRYAAVQALVNKMVGSSSQVKAGTYRCAVGALNVRSAPSKSSSIEAVYYQGNTVNLEEWSTSADGYIWGRYIGSKSGKYRYVAVRKQDGTDLLVLV